MRLRPAASEQEPRLITRQCCRNYKAKGLQCGEGCTHVVHACTAKATLMMLCDDCGSADIVRPVVQPCRHGVGTHLGGASAAFTSIERKWRSRQNYGRRDANKCRRQITEGQIVKDEVRQALHARTRRAGPSQCITALIFALASTAEAFSGGCVPTICVTSRSHCRGASHSGPRVLSMAQSAEYTTASTTTAKPTTKPLFKLEKLKVPRYGLFPASNMSESLDFSVTVHEGG